MPNPYRPEPIRRRDPRREVKILPPTVIPMTDEQRDEAVRALAALLRPVVRRREAATRTRREETE